MTKNDAPAPVDLPEKLRVHALAKLIGRTSREVVAALGGLGVEVKSAQSSIDRKVAEQVVTALVGDAAGAPSRAEVGAEAGAEVGPEVGAEVGAERGAAVDADAAAAAAPLAPLFAPPAPVFQPPGRPARGRRRAVSAPAEEAAEPAAEEAAVVSEASAPAAEAPARRRRRSRSAPPADEPVETAEPEAVAETEADTEVEDEADDEAGAAGPDDDDSGDASRRRRRRGRRGRGRGRGVDDESDEAGTDDDESDEEAGEETGADEGDEADDAGSSRRRRRRRRRRGSGDGDDEARPDDDPPGTVTRIRAPREPREARDTDDDGVQSVRGSTRLEAKRQRRRDGRDAGRRRQPILSEAEFLARRESVERTMVVRERGHRVEIGVLEDDVLVEHFIADRAGHDGGTGASGPSLVGNIYLGRVQNVLPSMEAAFVDIGRGRNAVLYAGEVDWDAAGLGGKARRIEQALGSGDSVLVQVTKDPIGHKGARLTTQISLAGRFLVYVPSGGAAGISRKLPDIERKRLKDMLKEIVPAEAGVIIRTASEGVSHEALERDVRRLQAQWDVVKEKSEKTGPQKPKAPVLLYEEPDLLIKVVRDQFNEDFSTLVVQGDDAWDTLHGYISHVAPELADRMHRHVGTQDAFAAHRIDEQLLKALDRKVWLPSGGTLVIDRTEAMTVVDVNTGKFTGSGGNLEETVTRNNLEAAEEIVRQLRLRDIGGIIVVDFIDMVLEANRDLVLRRLTECLARDRTRHQVAEVTSLGLVQMTRKRVGGGLLEHFSHPCEHCRGRGVVVDVELPEDTQDHGRPVSENGGSRRSRGGRRRGEGEGNGQNGRGGIAPGTGGSVPRPVAPAAAIMSDMAAAGTDTGAPAPSAAPAVAVVEGVDAAADAVEEAVVERTLVPPVAQVADTRVAAEPPAVENGVAPAPSEVAPSEEPAARPRRRGRVTRTAGAPATAAGDAPVAAVVTVAAGAPESAPAPAPVAPQPEPAAASRPRRSRRAASRPAGPPVDGGGDPS